MQQQHYANHKRWYLPHHFFFYALSIGPAVLCAYEIMTNPDHWKAWTFMGASFLLIAWLSYMLRQHYALTNQNRIVRLEMRLRYYILTQKRFEELEKGLSFGQIAALRFASDEELLALIDRTLKEKLSPDQIKRAIQDWQADHMRV